MLTVGVEEELLLLDPEGAVLPVAPDVVRRADDDRVKPELMTYQVETSSAVCRDLGELGRELTDLRRRVADAAASVGGLAVASGVAPMDRPGLEYLTDSPRYHQLAARFPAALASSGTCACHAHVGVPDRTLAVHVLGRLRAWLPALLALGTNSPMSGGRDTGWSSTRYRRQLRWPSFVAPRPWSSEAAYDGAVRSLLQRGRAFDARSVYYLARLSPRYPTIEIRVADTCLDAADAVLLAGVSRALVATLADDVRLGRPAVDVTDADLRADLLRVAVHGAPFMLPSPVLTGPAAAARPFVVERLLHKIVPQLKADGDDEVVLAGLERLARLGTGAQRQRRLAGAATTSRQLVSAMAAATVSEAAASTDAWSTSA
jgi:carboxylate-amine ligase